MYYNIIGVTLEYGKTDDTENLYPMTIVCTIQDTDDSDPRQVNIEFHKGDMTQLENLLRKRIDKVIAE